MASSSSLTESSFSAEPLLSELCPYCNTNPPKYRCPACGARSCSLPCSKRHKAFSQCTGIRDPTKYVKRSHLNSPVALNRDYNYLTGVEKAISRSPVLVHVGDDDGDNVDEDDEEKSGRDELLRKEMLAKHLEAKGILVRFAPTGMKRARENMTAMVGTRKRRKTVRWTVEWIVQEGGEEKRFLANKVPENKRLYEAYTEQLAEHMNLTNKTDRRRKTEASRFYLKKVDVPANQPTLIVISYEKSLNDLLKGYVVLEYPTIYVCDDTPKGFTIIEDDPRDTLKEENGTDASIEITNEAGVDSTEVPIDETNANKNDNGKLSGGESRPSSEAICSTMPLS